MIGAIAGDIIGSVYEARPIKSKDFPLFSPKSRFTDDTVLTVAVADAIMSGRPYADVFLEYFGLYHHVGFGPTFQKWARSADHAPYKSWGNGSAMRVSPVGWAFDTLDEVLGEAKRSAVVTHDHPEGVKGAQAVAVAVWLARWLGHDHETMEGTIRGQISRQSGYFLDETLDDIRPTYAFDVSCQGSVPQSIIAFLEATSYEDAVRNAVSLGGDADTMACIAGGIAEARYGVPYEIRQQAMSLLDDRLRGVVLAFEERYHDPHTTTPTR